MLNKTLNKDWKIDFFEIFATKHDDKEALKNADKLKIEHFPPVIAKFYDELSTDELKQICEGKLTLKKAKCDTNYNDSIIKTNYEKVIKVQLDNLMNQQIAQLQQEDPNFLKTEEKEIINASEIPFIKLMTLVYSKDTNQMNDEDKTHWKNNMNNFINQQIVFGIVNTYVTMKLYQDNIYTTTFQTPYNDEYIWNKYANNQQGLCVTYDFKEIKIETAKQLKKLYPILFSNNKLSLTDFDYTIYNSHCASLIEVTDNANEKDNLWKYIMNHEYSETEYIMLDNLLEPVYTKIMEHDKIQEILNTDYFEESDSELEYNYKKIMNNLYSLLSSKDFEESISKELEEIFNITDDEKIIDFMKPEAVYLARDFPEYKIKEYQEIIENENVKIFKIKQSDDKLFKSLI